MFTTMNSFLLFFIPATILFIIGMIFEDKLIEFEDGIRKSLSKSRQKKSQQKKSQQKKSVAKAASNHKAHSQQKVHVNSQHKSHWNTAA